MKASRPGESAPVDLSRGRRAGARVGATYAMPLRALDADELRVHTKRLTMRPHDPFNRDPVVFDAWKRDERFLYVPRFYGVQHWGEAATDDTIVGDALDHAFAGALTPPQVEAAAAVRAAFDDGASGPRGGMLVLSCGMGKTVTSLAIICERGRRALVLVHKTFLVEQWQERVRQFVPGATVGCIKQNRVDCDADIVIGMVQSIALRDYGADVFAKFGTLVVDEAHHMSAPVFSRALQRLPCRYVLALSATPERKDGMTNLLHYSMGPVLFKRERERGEGVCVELLVYDRPDKQKEITTRDGRPNLALMTNLAAADPARTALVAARLLELYAAGRCIIVLSERIQQLQAIAEALASARVPRDDFAFYIGKTPKEERERAGERRVLLSTYSMSREGLDIPKLDTLVMATPVGNVEQAVGRILRKHEGKQTPLVIDVVDPYSLFDSMRWKRIRWYRTQGYACDHARSA